ncbi:MAG TPA: hypothetical protein DCS13_06050 [Candidatus Margulisbacteria bacterium]|nr:MAG: hypothetical protein A2X43_05910 [Candidatus Margulisbacteria bacterium GWD2_39_127]HAR63012.1 hypothetical protein [Candidatus Margulisiibacteriota bacterium]
MLNKLVSIPKEIVHSADWAFINKSRTMPLDFLESSLKNWEKLNPLERRIMLEHLLFNVDLGHYLLNKTMETQLNNLTILDEDQSKLVTRIINKMIETEQNNPVMGRGLEYFLAEELKELKTNVDNYCDKYSFGFLDGVTQNLNRIFSFSKTFTLAGPNLKLDIFYSTIFNSLETARKFGRREPFLDILSIYFFQKQNLVELYEPEDPDKAKQFIGFLYDILDEHVIKNLIIFNLHIPMDQSNKPEYEKLANMIINLALTEEEENPDNDRVTRLMTELQPPSNASELVKLINNLKDLYTTINQKIITYSRSPYDKSVRNEALIARSFFLERGVIPSRQNKQLEHPCFNTFRTSSSSSKLPMLSIL